MAMFAVPQTLIPAPPAGYVNNIFTPTDNYVFNTTPYSGATRFDFGQNPGTGTAPWVDNGALNNYVDWNFPAEVNGLFGHVFSTTEAFKITTNVAATLGDGTMDVYIPYETVLIS